MKSLSLDPQWRQSICLWYYSTEEELFFLEKSEEAFLDGLIRGEFVAIPLESDVLMLHEIVQGWRGEVGH